MFEAECKCGRRWKPDEWHLSVMAHEMGRLDSGVRYGRTDYCPECQGEKVQSGIAALKVRVESGGCPGPLLWGKV